VRSSVGSPAPTCPRALDKVAVPLARAGTPGAWLRGWRLTALDGVMIEVPDTAANLAAYGKAVGGTRRPFPQTRSVGLVECGTHAVIAARLGTIYQGERELASHLRGRVTGEMLVIADRGFHSYQGVPPDRRCAVVAGRGRSDPRPARGPARRLLPRRDPPAVQPP